MFLGTIHWAHSGPTPGRQVEFHSDIELDFGNLFGILTKTESQVAWRREASGAMELYVPSRR